MMSSVLLSILLILAFSGPTPTPRPVPQPAPQPSTWEDDSDFAETEVTDLKAELSPNARVEISGINGTVEVETGNSSTAEIHIVRSARSKADLAYHKVLVETTPSSLVIKGDPNRENRNRRNVRQRVTLRMPRNVSLSVSGVNGATKIGTVEGPVDVSGINGRVTIAQASGHARISGINGSVNVTIARLEERGIKISGINGRVEIGLLEDVNADINVTGINGSVQFDDGMNVTVQGKIAPSSFHGKIGAGGTPITLSGINGSVRFSRGALASLSSDSRQS